VLGAGFARSPPAEKLPRVVMPLVPVNVAERLMLIAIVVLCNKIFFYKTLFCFVCTKLRLLFILLRQICPLVYVATGFAVILRLDLVVQFS
jgi:ABC-type uncharacterized transport system permease subunit